MYFDDDALIFILEILRKHHKNIRRAHHYNDFVENALKHFAKINDRAQKKEITKYILNLNNYLDLLSDDEAVVYNLKQGYGFCKNKHYPNGIYFSMQGISQNIDYGDILKFSSILENTKGKFSVVCPRIVGKMIDRVNIEKSI